jgi:hypothetical protein
MKREIPTLKATGQQGRWFAEVDGFGWLPVVHKAYFDFKTLTYHHPDLAGAFRSSGKAPEYLTALRGGRYAIMTDDDIVADPENGEVVSVKRKGYIAIWEYDCFVEADEPAFGHTMRMVDRIAHLK